MERITVLKLGGSIISDKAGKRAVVKTRRVKEIATEIAKALRRRPQALIVLHGAGSFGHPLVHRYKLAGRRLDGPGLRGLGRTMLSMRNLGDQLASLLLAAGVPVVPLQSSSLVRVRGGKVKFIDHGLIDAIVAAGGVPLFGGDVVVDEDGRIQIASADALAAELSNHFARTRLLFATDVDGVYDNFPPKRGEQAIGQLDRAGLTAVLKKQRSRLHAGDTTGAMAGKLRSISVSNAMKAIIFNGTRTGAVSDVLRGVKRGTTIDL